jgi:hypothetical protein
MLATDIGAAARRGLDSIRELGLELWLELKSEGE